MAGSYKHVTDENGKLYTPEDFVKMIGNPGDAYEAIEEMYGMIWYLAGTIDVELDAQVEAARQNYLEGLELSPGTNGRLPDDDWH